MSPATQLILDSPIGALRVHAEHGAITIIEFNAEPCSGDLTGAGILPAPLEAAASQLQEYFAATRRSFELPLAPRGTAFQRAVWEQLRRLPYGETSCYGALARASGRPRSSRAVGAAIGANPLPIVVPCHRVIGADGSLTGFAGGLSIKRQLLRLEGLTVIAERVLPRTPTAPDAAAAGDGQGLLPL